MTNLKVKYLPLQPHCFAFGGFEVQTLSAFDAIKESGYDVEKMNVWDRSADFDILHCWGLSVANYENYYWAKKSGKTLVATVLLYYYESFYSKFKFHVSSVIHAQKFLKQMLTLPDAVVVVNDKQANVCNLMYKVPADKIKIIPNIVNDNFFSEGESNVGNKYLLTVGNVCKRKNQLLLAEACVGKDISLLIIGKALDGEPLYAEKLDELVRQNSNIKWIKGLKENSSELVDYYRNCFAYVLPSLAEQQPISALEAAVLKKPLLLADLDYAKQSYFNNACLVDPLSKNSIVKGIDKIKMNPDLYIPEYHSLIACKQRNVAAAYIDLYNSLAK